MQNDRGEGRQREFDRPGLAVALGGDGFHAAEIAHVAAAVDLRISVQHLLVEARQRDADPVSLVRDRREVGDHDGNLALVLAPPRPGDHAVVGVVGDEPLEAGRLRVTFVQGGNRAVDHVQIANERLDAMVETIVEKMPVETLIVVPLPLLGDLAAHEEKLLAGMSPHEAVIGAQIRETLPPVPWHPAEERPLAVHDFVVAQRQDEVLAEGVD